MTTNKTKKTMVHKTARHILLCICVIFFPITAFADHSAVLQEIDAGLNTIFLCTGLALISLLLLVAFRNKPLGILSFISGILLIVVANNELYRYLLTDNWADFYILSGFILMALSVILGWIYPKNPSLSGSDSLLMVETETREKSKKELTLYVMFACFIVYGAYSATVFYFSFPNSISLPLYFLTNVLPLLFLIAIAYLFIRKTQSGWILGAGYILSLIFGWIISQVNVLIIYIRYPDMNFIGFFPLLNLTYLAIAVICLVFILSGAVRAAYQIKRNQMLLTLVTGIVISILFMYISVQNAKQTMDAKMSQQEVVE